MTPPTTPSTTAAPTGAPPAPRRRTARGEGGRLRADILAAAAELLDETGDEQAVTLRAVARRVGVSAPALYAHFSDRQQILLAVVRSAFSELTEALAGRPAATPGAGVAADPAAHLRGICARYLDFAASHPQRYRVMFGGLWNARQAVEAATMTATQATDLGRDALAVITEALEACVREGVSRSTDPATDAVALWLGLHGLAHQRAVIPSFPWPPDVADHLIGPLARLSGGAGAG